MAIIIIFINIYSLYNNLTILPETISFTIVSYRI